MKNTKQFVDSLNKLQKFHWSVHLPEAYLAASGKGLGEIAKLDYGAFNVAWALRGKEDLLGAPESLHVQAIQVHQLQREDNKLVVEGAPLSDWLTLLSPIEFTAWVKKHKSHIPVACYNRVSVASLNATILVRL